MKAAKTRESREKKKEKWRRKQRLRPSKATPHVCCFDSGPFVCVYNYKNAIVF